MATLKINVAQLLDALQFVSEIAQVAFTQKDASLVHAIGEVFGSKFPVTVAVGPSLGSYAQRLVAVIISRGDFLALHRAGLDTNALTGGNFAYQVTEQELIFPLGGPQQNPHWSSPFPQYVPASPYQAPFPQYVPAPPFMRNAYQHANPWMKNEQAQPLKQHYLEFFDELQEHEKKRLSLDNEARKD